METKQLIRRLQRIASSFNSKARAHHVPGLVVWQMLAVAGHNCAYCNIWLDTLEEGTWDHALAFNRGGTNEISNIVRCCTSCQRRKFDKTPAEFAAHKALTVTCPIDGTVFQPRWAEHQRGMARYCSRRCAGKAGANKREENKCEPSTSVS